MQVPLVFTGTVVGLPAMHVRRSPVTWVRLEADLTPPRRLVAFHRFFPRQNGHVVPRGAVVPRLPGSRLTLAPLPSPTTMIPWPGLATIRVRSFPLGFDGSAAGAGPGSFGCSAPITARLLGCLGASAHPGSRPYPVQSRPR